MFKEMKENENGFTLVELIVVIAIMAVLATLLIPRIMGNVAEAAKQKEVTTAQTLASELTIHNAKMLADNDDSTDKIGATAELVVGDVPASLAFPADKFPDKDVVTISIDSNGNATINIK